MMTNIQLKPGFAKPIWAGNPFIYPKAVELWPATLEYAQWVPVTDAGGQLIGHGVYNPHSLYRIRMLAWAREQLTENTLEAALHHRVAQAIELRRRLNLPNEETNAYRLINSEGDQLSGVTVDIFNQHVVIAITCGWAVKHHALLESVLKAQLPGMTFIWRFLDKPLKQEGWDQPFPVSQADQPDTMIQIKENGVLYQMDPYKGQKTGFYCDQRETRTLVQRYANDRNVLDLCCFTGGFAFHAALGGAHSVMGVDSSEAAIALARENASINNLDQVNFLEGDLSDALNNVQDVDFIILDPPKLAPSQKHLHKALRHYTQLNELALRALNPEGLLLTCSCSQAVSMSDLQRVLADAAMHAGKTVQILHSGGAGPDHPVNVAFMESAYLKWMLVRVI